MLGTVLYFLADRTVERIDLSREERRRLMSDLEDAVPAGGHIVGMLLGEPGKPLMRVTGSKARPRELTNAYDV